MTENIKKICPNWFRYDYPSRIVGKSKEPFIDWINAIFKDKKPI